jgi:erythromycin esterase
MTTNSKIVIPLEMIAWLREHVIPFETSKPASGFEDLKPLQTIIGPSHIIALGESTHGTHEYFEMKHRLLEYLVNEMGFTIFAIEMDSAAANLINNYVQTGQGDPACLLAVQSFRIWKTQEVLDLILWMRQYNELHGDVHKLNFCGFDMQSPRLEIDNVIAYLKTVDLNRAKWAMGLYECFPDQSSEYVRLSPAVKAKYRAGLEQIHDYLLNHRPEGNNTYFLNGFDFALHAARLLLQAEDLFSQPSASYSMVRDQYMAENVTWLLDWAGSDFKIVLWAHNIHMGVIEDDRTSFRSMGSYLRERYGTDIVIFGLIFYSGKFNAINENHPKSIASPIVAPVPLSDSYESFFHNANCANLFLDLQRQSLDSPTTAWLFGSHPLFFFGATYDADHVNQYLQMIILPKVFDVIVFFQETTPSTLLKPQSN